MNWFQQLCRNTGLMFHNIAHPDGSRKQVVSSKVEEQRVDETTVLRRTTIEEVEIKHEEKR